MFTARHDVRGGIATAYATLITGTAAIFFTGDADYFSDMIEIQMSNNSTVAVGIDLTQDGSKIRHFEIPANTTIEIAYDVPLKQNTIAVPWIIDMPDITGTSVEIAASFIKNHPKS